MTDIILRTTVSGDYVANCAYDNVRLKVTWPGGASD